MNCKKCGCDTLLSNGEWLVCPVCGAEYYNIDAEYAKISGENNRENSEDKSVSEHRVAFSENQTASKAAAERNEEPDLAPEPTPQKSFIPEESKEEHSVLEDEANVSKKAYYVDEKDVEIPPISHNDDFTDGFFDNSEEEFSVKGNDFTDNSDAFFGDDGNGEDFSTDKDPSEFTPEEEYAYHEGRKRKRQNEKEKKKKSKLRDTIEFLLPILLAIVVAYVLKTFVIANAYVPTGSMTPTINAKENIIASRLAYNSNSPKRYDIVLFYYPDDEEQLFVKRILASSGETLTVTDGVVYVTTKDGKTIQTVQSFVNPEEKPRGDFGPYYVPEKGEVITERGDLCYAENGLAVGNSEFISKYCVRDKNGNYVIADNLYFMMGDNRNTSLDSRAWKFAYVAEDKIVGKVLFKYWPKFEKLS